MYSGLNPTECNGNDGSITIVGLSPNTNYNLTYNDNSVVVGPTVYTTASNGNILISNLNAGNYTNFNLNINGCDYSNLIPVVLVNPVLIPNFTISQPTCTTPTGTIEITSPLGVDYTYSIDGIN